MEFVVPRCVDPLGRLRNVSASPLDQMFCDSEDTRPVGRRSYRWNKILANFWARHGPRVTNVEAIAVPVLSRDECPCVVGRSAHDCGTAITLSAALRELDDEFSDVEPHAVRDAEERRSDSYSREFHVLAAHRRAVHGDRENHF